MPEISASKYLVQAGWDDAAHLTAEAKVELLASTPPHLRDARSKGIPSLGSGAIYPIAIDDIKIDPFPIPAYWPRVYGMDVGWNRTAAIWGAIDRESGTVYLYSEHYRGQAEPEVHAAAIKARGEWIPGVIDPASRGRSQVDGKRLYDIYYELGLKLITAENAVEAGIYAVLSLLSTGRLKIFPTLTNFFSEYGRYKRDENGKIVKEHDHLLDCVRYLVMTGLPVAAVKPIDRTLVPQYIAADNDIGY